MHFLSLDFKLRFLKKTAINHYLKWYSQIPFLEGQKGFCLYFLRLMSNFIMALTGEHTINCFLNSYETFLEKKCQEKS
jgi:hypothetical protein